MEPLLMFYFTLVLYTGHAEQAVTSKSYGPYHKQYVCEKVLEAKVLEIEQQAQQYTTPAVTIIAAVPCAQVVELKAVLTGVNP